MQLSDLKSNPRGGKRLRNIIDRSVGAHLYPPPGSEHYKFLILDRFCVPSHINNYHEKKNE